MQGTQFDSTPVRVLKSDTQHVVGDTARMTATVGAIAIADLVKTTLGPMGMDKILIGSSQADNITVTNDGATILKSVRLENPAAKVLVEMSKTTDEEVGDGTTSVTVLAGELMREAEKLMAEKIHPQVIIEGWRIALKAAQEKLETMQFDVSSDHEAYKKRLMDIARTTLSSKILSAEKEKFAQIAVDAIEKIGDADIDNVVILQKIGGEMRESYLEDGFLLEKKFGTAQKHKVENPKIMVANTAMDNDRIKIWSGKVKVDSVSKVAEIEEAERTRMLKKCEQIKAHGVTCFVSRQLIYPIPEQFFNANGIVSIDHADFDGVERIAALSGAEILSTFDHPDEAKLGTCKSIEEIMIGEETLIRFSGFPHGGACTVVLRGPSKQLLGEMERSLHDALCVLHIIRKDTKMICGGGCVEMELSLAVEEAAKKTEGKKALAVEAFARALRQLPMIIADNAGYDSADLVAQLRAAHANNSIQNAGLDMEHGTIADMKQIGIIEPFRVKKHILTAATEAAEMIIRVDHIIQAAPRKREQR
ncbi:T-complex protein 1 subunit beta, putative [Entamoeba dispar SAW760]|uniref:CCT-beta n=1 Tax=Entamoeba dispar (strain ATCC PRA-260 / SAW760) TaxID=370354 RepID=B0EUC9_ENTDS|nr:T-complex protein 1 subunit beta, putative [Entamoeba dispar SAW760]EDR21880.1 T-complex protein 1 subunit beta, putative [Entamoeba dispar SAW760]|eukprot:EDR21880.1 T-complex protein 1 subunit beta, putative [Entamoeba dispar SAW760]